MDRTIEGYNHSKQFLRRKSEMQMFYPWFHGMGLVDRISSAIVLYRIVLFRAKFMVSGIVKENRLASSSTFSGRRTSLLYRSHR